MQQSNGINRKQLMILTSITIIGLIFSFIRGIPLAAGFLPGLVTLMMMVKSAGFSWITIGKSVYHGAVQTREIIWILVFIGLLIPSWMASGTTPYMIEKGLQYVIPDLFLTSAFVMAAIISLILGTSMGTLSTIGIPLTGMANVLGIPLAYVGGALVSGAFVGDRTSPFSSSRHLMAIVTEVSHKEQGKTMLPTTIAAFIISLVFFVSFDIYGDWKITSIQNNDESFTQWFTYSPLLILPPVLLIGTMIAGGKVKHAFPLAIASSILIGTVYQNISVGEWLQILLFGFHETGLATLQSQGLLNMASLMIFIALTGCFNGILEKTRILHPYFEKILATADHLSTATYRTIFFGLGMNLISCNQTLPIMISGRNLLPFWSKRFQRQELARVIADSTHIFAGLIPWNMLAILCSTVLGITVIDYLPYAVFLWSLPFLTVILSYAKTKSYAGINK